MPRPATHISRRDFNHAPLKNTPTDDMPLNGLTILLVEDSRYVSDAIRLMSTRLGARLRRTATIEQTQIHMRTYRPDVMIVDLGLPDGRGESLIQEAASMEAPPIIIGMSGHPERRNAAVLAGAMGFFEKPIGTLAQFQNEILRHMPKAHTAKTPSDALFCADPIALHDDLLHAYKLLQAGNQTRGYLLAFLAGIARSCGDSALMRAVDDALLDEVNMPALHDILSEKIAIHRAI